MGLPFEPETIEQAKARLGAALDPVYHQQDVLDGRPAQDRKHVFDFEDGMRLIVSRDELNGVEASTHVSASFEVEGAWKASGEVRLKRGLLPFLVEVGMRWTALGRSGHLMLIGQSPAGIPHLIEIQSGQPLVQAIAGTAALPRLPMPDCPQCKIRYNDCQLEEGDWIVCKFCGGIAQVLRDGGVVGVQLAMTPLQIRPELEAAQRQALQTKGSVN